MLSCRQHWILCGHSAVNFLAIFFYNINTKPCWIKSISLINFLGSGDVGSHKNTRKSNLVTGGITTQLEMCTEVMLDQFLLDRLHM